MPRFSSARACAGRIGLRMLCALVLGSALDACQAPAAKLADAGGGTLPLLAAAVNRDYDNHEQVERMQSDAAKAAAPLRVFHSLHRVEQRRDEVSWLWLLQPAPAAEGTIWFVRATSEGGAIRLIPYRALDAAAAKAAFAEPASAFHFEPGAWAELDACALVATASTGGFAAGANVEACSALLPGLGPSAALLPLRLEVDGDVLHVATYADLSRGPQAVELARRVRWFGGWAAINGGGPQANAANQDWHVQRDLRIASEGGRVALRWRDGAASGYTIELERTTYPERKLAVLQLNVIEDTGGKTVTYAWTDPGAHAIGINLGWLQVGLQETAGAGE